MRIKHLTLMSGPAGNFPIGHERDIEDKQGRELIDGGYAVEIKPRMPETATARHGQTATAAEQHAAEHLQRIAAAGAKAKKSRRGNASPEPETEGQPVIDPVAAAEAAPVVQPGEGE